MELLDSVRPRICYYDLKSAQKQIHNSHRGRVHFSTCETHPIHCLITPVLACAGWTAAASKCYNPANMDALVPHRCRDTAASSSKCPHPSEAPQNNYLQQDPITRLYIKALKATFDRMLHLLKEQSGAPSSDQFL